jgi:rare lipoprotein A
VKEPHSKALRRALAAVGLCAAWALACAHPPSFPAGTAEEGHASYYAARFDGRQTASGERYDPRALTAAHRSLPFGSVVRVSRVEAGGALGPSVDVRIHDRGPFVKGRIIDLSAAAAHELDMLADGIARVRVWVLALP